MPTKVRGGVWRFGVSAAANAETDFHLEGGDLEVAPGVALEIGEIVPGAGSRVVLGEGATLAMAKPSSEWPEGGVLDFIVPGGGSSVSGSRTIIAPAVLFHAQCPAQPRAPPESERT